MSEDRPPDEERRKPGRPRLFDDPSELTIRLDASLHDQIVKEAASMGDVSVGAAARSLIAWALTMRRRVTSTR